ncbi:MAG: 5-oxoprolinase subunit PxpB [Clostridiaceae bacterium]|nr:5-oxoprolinase subunit PxpB [Clostridiaceae bacterium]
MRPDIRFCGDRAVTLCFQQEISPAVNAAVCGFASRFSAIGLEGVIEIVPTYCAVTIHFDPAVLDLGLLISSIEASSQQLDEAPTEKAETVVVPVAYGGEFGPDMANVMAYTGLTDGEIIRRHSEREYLIYMLGFTPGFPYMGGMDESIATPRLNTPRTAIPSGSVGIAGSQTGVYPIASPGGWQLIGRTPLKLFDIERENPFLLKAGQKVKFTPISAEEYERMANDD